MKEFMDKDFLLSNDVAKKLYHDYAESMPIYDYHCHLSPRMIYENYQFSNIGELMLGGDHYKWRVMLSNGVDEKYIRGDASWHDKWLAFAASLKYCIGNPMFHWTHLELRRVWNACKAHGCVLLVTADHGNADEMLQKNKKGELQPRTAHSLNPVPFIICDDEPHALKDGKFGLANVAPTVAQLLGLTPPACWMEGMLK